MDRNNGMQVNFVGLPVVDGSCNVVTTQGGSSSSAEARRKRKLVVAEKDRGFVKRRRAAVYRGDEFVPPPLPQNIMNQGRLVFLFCKKLQNSDVNNVGRTVLPKQPTETHLPRLVDNESIVLYVIDMDGVDAWGLKFRYWANNQSRMYVFEGTGPFTKKHGLETGDYMLVYRDLETWDYVIRAVKAYEVEGFANKEVTTTGETKAESVLPNDATFDLFDYSPNLPIAESVLPNDATFDLFDYSPNLPIAESVLPNDATFDLFDYSPNLPTAESVLPNDAAFDLVDYSPNLPIIGDMLGATIMNDDYYFSDILNSFSAWDDYMTNYYPTSQPNILFDNLSDEDLSQV